MNAKILDLDKLSRGRLPGMTARAGGALAEACAVCLEDQQHECGVELIVDGSVDATCSVLWGAVTNQQRCTHNDLQDATEDGGYAIAILLTIDLTDYTIIQRSKKGTGFDYWLGRKDDPGPLFQNAARLEVSGILNNPTDIASRAKDKCDQVRVSDNTGLPAFIVIVEFSTPTSRFLKQ